MAAHLETMVSEIHLEEFLTRYENALVRGEACLFAGAGLSQPFVNWKELLRELAEDIGLDVDREHDLVAVAQYHYNDRKTRSKINQKLIDEFTRDAKLTENHKLIANLPIRTVWTTNYDTLLEEAFKNAHKRCDVKIAPENLATTVYHADVTIYKMHGDINSPDKAVLTKQDYENYNKHRQLFTTCLQGDLVTKTFLFLGFSFTDPNIDYILSRIRVLLGKNTRDHYCVMRRIPKPKPLRGAAKADYEYQLRSQQHRITDLALYGIRVLLVEDFSEITEMLRRLNRRAHLNDVFVSGSAADYSPRGKGKLEELAIMLGRELFNRGFNLVSGFGLGIGGHVVTGSLEASYGKHESIDERMALLPFPQGVVPEGMTHEEFLRKYREDMLRRATFAIFISGNKHDATSGSVTLANGVLQEFELAKELKLYPVPIGATGHASARIWEIVYPKLHEYFPNMRIKGNFQTLNNQKKSNREIVDAVFAIINRVKGRSK